MSQKHATSIQKNYGLYEYLMPLNLYETTYIASTSQKLLNGFIKTLQVAHGTYFHLRLP
jgi:hypothetical protein